jgi:hypothetical protein
VLFYIFSTRFECNLDVVPTEHDFVSLNVACKSPLKTGGKDQTTLKTGGKDQTTLETSVFTGEHYELVDEIDLDLAAHSSKNHTRNEWKRSKNRFETSGKDQKYARNECKRSKYARNECTLQALYPPAQTGLLGLVLPNLPRSKVIPPLVSSVISHLPNSLRV